MSLIPDGAVTAPSGPLKMALHRYSLACQRENATDALVDCVICLESIFTPGMKHEAGYRFKTQGALFLNGRRAGSIAVAKLLGALYDARSSLVHGNKIDTKSWDFKYLLDDAHHCTRAALRRCLDNGFPTPEDYQRWLLEEKSPFPKMPPRSWRPASEAEQVEIYKAHFEKLLADGKIDENVLKIAGGYWRKTP